MLDWGGFVGIIVGIIVAVIVVVVLVLAIVWCLAQFIIWAVHRYQLVKEKSELMKEAYRLTKVLPTLKFTKFRKLVENQLAKIEVRLAEINQELNV